MPVSMVTTKPSELFSSVPPCQHCGANRIFELQFMPALIGNLKLAKQTCANLTGDLSSQNNKHEAETEQFSNSNNVHNLGRLDNNICEDNGGNLSDNTALREDQNFITQHSTKKIHLNRWDPQSHSECLTLQHFCCRVKSTL